MDARGVGRSVARFALVAVLLTASAGCVGAERRLERFRDAYELVDFATAEAEVDALLARTTDADLEEVAETRGLSEEIEPERGDVCLYLLEKAMVRAAQGDPEAAVRILRRSRDAFDERRGQAARTVASLLTDDRARRYEGADYEMILIRAFLAIFELLREGKDAYAYALQINEKQEEILKAPLSEEAGEYNPREHYRRVAIGAYLEGLLHEAEFSNDSARKAYERAQAWLPGNPIVDEAVRRVSGEVPYAAEGHGVVHLFYFAGRGPRLVQGRTEISELALDIAKTWAIASGRNQELIGQAPVPVPVVVEAENIVPPLEIVTADGHRTLTTPLLDTATVAAEQLDANMPWILARAALRRAAKGVAASAARRGAEQKWGEGSGIAVGAAVNALTTVFERADTRHWRALPAQIQVARVMVPAGESTLELGSGMSVPIRVGAGQESYVLVVRPSLALPGVVLVDEYSRVEETTPTEAALTSETTTPEPAGP